MSNPPSGTDIDDLVAGVLRAAPVLDGHNDLAWALREVSGYAVDGLDTGRPDLQTDIPRLRAGGVGGQFWSVFVPSDRPEPEAVVATLEQVDAVYRIVAAYPRTFRLAFTADEVEQSFAAGRIASLLGIEGGHSIATSLGVLRAFARLGVRYLTLTHNDNTSWADSATDSPGVGGLDATGRAVVAELNRIGVLADLSHVAEPTMHAALDATTAPVIFSHSSTRALCDHPRNVPDGVIERLRANGGVVQITFVPRFVSDRARLWQLEADAERERLGLPDPDRSWPRAPRPGEPAAEAAHEIEGARAPAAGAAPARAAYRTWLDRHPRPEVGVAEVADHVEHARQVAGVEHVGLGGDYDGVAVQPRELADVAGYPRLLRELARRGWSAPDLAALTSGNVLRVLRAAEHAADEPLWPAAGLR